MRGGLKVYRGSAAAARHYVKADRGRADDYYLAEGTGVAERYVASLADGVHRAAPLSGDAYEAWVAGIDPESGEPKGRLRNDENAVRFVEVVVNGPKSWSLAAGLHPDISVAYDAAQESAAQQIIGWLAQHATTRVGPRGAQVQVPVTQIDTVTVRHHTSRAGDPHRHLHLQINARVLADGRWRGLHTVGVRDSLDAINGIGHAAVMTDPGLRTALAAHGYSLDPDTGEVVQLAVFVGPFSARATQIARNVDRYEADWRAANAGCEPSTKLRRAWDARAWADARPDKVVPRDGAELTGRWVDELHDLGFRKPSAAAAIDNPTVGSLDREHAVEDVLTRLAARRSAWNAADIRGEVEQLLARRNVVTAASVRCELAEDLTARTVAECIPMLSRDGAPEHIRALTSRHVLDVEADLVGRIAARADTPVSTPATAKASNASTLDRTQQQAVGALAGDARLLVLEGAAGAGKTTVLAATRAAVEERGHQLMVVTPTLKAAEVAAHEVGTRAHSAAWLAYQYGYRWRDDGSWTRLAHGDVDLDTGIVFTGPRDPAQLQPDDLLLVDEAAMLDQDTARALMTIADERNVRVALVGDRHQLPAVGRGGVLDLAVRFAAPEACLTLDSVHRFTRTMTSADGSVVTLTDDEYGQLSLAMRAGGDPGAVFDALLDRGQIRIHKSDDERHEVVGRQAADALREHGRRVLIADTRDQVAALNALIRDRLVASGHVDDVDGLATDAGQRICTGDRVATRRNDVDLAVANRDIWTVTRVRPDGVEVTGERGSRTLPAAYVREYVELAYASTVHGVQGETARAADLVVGDHTSAASAYVGMTRGREGNVAHLVADTVADARDQWVAVFARDRADLGPTHAAELARQEASRYATQRPLDVVLTELHTAWTDEANCSQRLADAERRRELLTDIVALVERRDAIVPGLQRAYGNARNNAEQATRTAQSLENIVQERTEQIRTGLQRDWEAQRAEARSAGNILREGPGRLGHRLRAVNRASEDLAAWSVRWQLYLPTMPTRTEDVAAFARWFDDMPRIREAFERYARPVAEASVPEYAKARDAAERAVHIKDEAGRDYRTADGRYRVALDHYGRLSRIDDPATALAEAEQTIAGTGAELRAATGRVERLLAEPAVRSQSLDFVLAQRDQWQIDRDARARELRSWTTVGPGATRAYVSRGYAVSDVHPDDPSPHFGR